MIDDKKISKTETEQYMLFSVGGELYGDRLIAIKEIVQPRIDKTFPSSNPALKGIMQIRENLVQVFDLAILLGYKALKTLDTTSLLVIDSSEEYLFGALVDTVINVSRIDKAHIDTSVVQGGQKSFLYGIAKEKEKLINLVDIKMILSAQNKNYR